MLTVKLIEAILIEQDPEGLISMGAPEDEYISEAETIYSRIINETKVSIIDYTNTIVFVFAEAFSPWSNEDNVFGYDNTYLSFKRIERFKIIGKLLHNMANKDQF